MSKTYWDDDEYCNPSMKIWFTISKDRSNSQVFLTMTNMDIKDTSTYYSAQRNSDIDSGAF
jgi:hypothetical protein